jgi:tetratricopeptide (TPR) repeat protein
MVLATARPELYDTRAGWGGGRRNSATLGLSPLSDEDTARLVSSLLERSVLPAETQAALLERAGGNPLYTEQFVRMLGDRGPASGADLPETVQALLAARLDTLATELKSLLHDASVLGKVFWTGALATMGDRPRDDVLITLRELVRREFARPSRLSSMRDEEEFSFWHVLVRDVAYQQIPRAARGRKHVQAAEWIEREAGSRVADHAEFLVYHYSHAVDLGRAAGEDVGELEERLVRFSGLAGDRAMQLDVGAAESAYRRALDAVAEPAARAEIQVKLADAINEQGRLVDAENLYEEAIPVLRSSDRGRQAALAQLGLARALWRHGRTSRARELTYQAVGTLESHGGPDLVVAYERAAGADALGGRSREAIDWAEKGLALAAELGVENVVRLLQMRGIARDELGIQEGLDDLRDALNRSLGLGLGIDTGTAYLNYAESMSPTVPLIESFALLEASEDFARRRGLEHHVMWTRGAKLWHFYETGRWDELLSEAEEVMRWDAEQGGTQIEVNAKGAKAPVLVHRGALDEARRCIDVVLPRAREIEDLQALAPALEISALVSLANGDREGAATLIAEYEDLTRGTPKWRAWGLPSAVRVSLGAGRLDLASLLVEGSSLTMNLQDRATSTSGQAMVAEARGDFESAKELYREALALWREWGSLVETACTCSASAAVATTRRQARGWPCSSSFGLLRSR